MYIYRVAILCSDRLPARYIRVFMFKWRLLATDHHLPFYINTAKEVLKWIDDVRDMLIDERYQAALTALDSMDWLCPCVAAACAGVKNSTCPRCFWMMR